MVLVMKIVNFPFGYLEIKYDSKHPVNHFIGLEKEICNVFFHYTGRLKMLTSTDVASTASKTSIRAEKEKKQSQGWDRLPINITQIIFNQ